MTVFLHIGLHKTGTSSLQSFVHNNRDVFQAGGIAVPQAGWLDGGHHNVPLELLGRAKFDPARGGLEATLPEIDARPHALLTSEEFEFLDLDGIRRLRDGLGARDAKVLIYLRRQDELIASTYAQQIKMGARLGDFSDYVTASLYHPRFDFFLLMMRWSKVFGEEAMSTAVICPETSGPRLFDDFLGRMGAPGLPAVRPDKLLNPTPSWPELELMRRLAVLLKPKGRKFMREELQRMKSLARRRLKADGMDEAVRLKVQGGHFEQVRARFAAGNARVAREFVQSPLQQQALAFPAGQGEVRDPPAEAAYFDQVAAELARDFHEGAGTPPAPRDQGPKGQGPKGPGGKGLGLKGWRP